VTYSIIAHDPETGALGGAMQSHFFNAGPWVLFAEPGVGIVAAQMMAERAYGARGLAAMREGKSAADALVIARDADPAWPTRQVAMLDAQGRVAHFTGAACVAHSSHAASDGVVTQAAMCRSPGTAQAMLDAYALAHGTFAERLVAALVAAEQEGGDIRGQKSAAMLVVAGTASAEPWRDRMIDLHVEDSPHAVEELRRFVALHGFHGRANSALDLALAGNAGGSLALFAELEREDGHDPDAALRHALVLTLTGSVPRARERLECCYRLHEGWRELIRRLAAAGLLPDDPAVIAALTAPH
jgi:uncharacterized Ntn-hydrolase superfamily protein